MIKKLLFVALAFAAGVALGLYVPVTNLLTIPQPLQSAFTRIQTVWTSLPDIVKTITITGIPTLFVMFFAWTKSRAMQKLDQVKRQVTDQLGQLQGESLEQLQQIKKFKTDLAAKETEIKTLQSQLANTPNQAAYTQLEANYQKLQNDYNLMESTLQNAINDLKQKEKIIVK